MERRRIAAIHLCLLLVTSSAFGEVVGVEVIEVESPTFDGRTFGDVGPYEKITLRVTMAVDPEDPHNAEIVDLGLAPPDAAGRVRFSTPVVVVKPIDMERGNGHIYYEVVNRGNKYGLDLFNDARWTNEPSAARHAGNGFLVRKGYTLVWSGWQHDAPPGEARLVLESPTVTGIEDVSREEFIFNHDRNPAVASLTYPAGL